MRAKFRAVVVGVWIIALALVAIATSSVYSTFIEDDDVAAESVGEVVEAIERINEQAEYDACIDRIWAHNDGLANLQDISGNFLGGEEGGSVSQSFLFDSDALTEAGWGIGLAIVDPEFCGTDPSP